MSNIKGEMFVRSYRIANHINSMRGYNRIFCYPILVLYKLVFNYILTFEIPPETEIGSGLRCFHCFGIVIHKEVKVGRDLLLRHNVTIGNKYSNGGVPILGNNISIGSGAVILGDIVIGDNVVIGANAVVTKNVPANTLVVGINEFKSVS